MNLADISKLGVANPFRQRYDNFIGGKFVAPVKGEYFANVTPISGQPFCEVARSTAEDVDLALDVADLGTLYTRFVEQVKRGETLGPDVSMLKLFATETYSRLANLLVEIAGASGGVPGDIDVDGSSIDVLTTFYNARPATIYGGSNEIQRNILASAVLQLPS